MSAPEDARPLRILLADDHALFRRGVRDVIDDEADMRVVAEAADGEEAVRRARELRPDGLDLVLMDVDMPRLDGIGATARLAQEDPALPVIMLTVSSLERDLVEAARAGAVGFLSKNLAPAAMVRALRDFHAEGSLPMSRVMAARLLRHLQQALRAEPTEVAPADPQLVELSEREWEVLGLVAAGARDREIAEQLVLAESTVKKHVQNILRKLDARNRAEAAARFHNRPR